MVMDYRSIRLAIVIGHTRKSPGAQGLPFLGSEYEFNTGIAEQMYKYAYLKGLIAKPFFRDIVGIAGVYKEVNEWLAYAPNRVSIELHFNASTDLTVSGTEVLYDDSPPESKEFAQLVQNNLCLMFSRSPKGNRGAKLVGKDDRGGPNMIFATDISVLVEPAFGTNAYDAKLLWSSQSSYAKCLVNTVIEHFETKCV